MFQKRLIGLFLLFALFTLRVEASELLEHLQDPEKANTLLDQGERLTPSELGTILDTPYDDPEKESGNDLFRKMVRLHGGPDITFTTEDPYGNTLTAPLTHHLAAMEDMGAERLMLLLELGADPDAQSADGKSLLLKLLATETTSGFGSGFDPEPAALTLLAKGAKVDIKDEEGKNALQIAMRYDWRGEARPLYRAIEVMIRRGLDPRVLLADGGNPYAWTSDLFLQLVFMNAGVSGVDEVIVVQEDKDRLLALACLYRFPEAAKALLRLGADRNRVFAGPDSFNGETWDDILGLSPQELEYVPSAGMLQLAVIGGSADTVRLLLASGDQEALSDQLRAAVIWSAEHNREMLTLLLREGALDGSSLPSEVLIAAVDGGDVVPVKTLLAGGMDIEGRDEQGRTPLLRAAWHCDMSVLRVLMEAGADLKARDEKWERNVFHWLSSGALIRDESNAQRVIVDLAAGGADLSAKDAEGETPLTMAIHRLGPHRTNLLWSFLDAGATLPLGEPQVCYDMLRRVVAYRPAYDPKKRSEALVARLLTQGVPVDLDMGEKDYGTTPLVAASQYASMDVVTTLLDAGAKVNRADAAGETPLFWALSRQREDVMALLIERGAWIDRMVPAHRVSVRQLARVMEDVEACQAVIAASDQQRPLRQPYFPPGFTEAEPVTDNPIWRVPGWRVLSNSGEPGYVAQDGRYCDAVSQVAALKGWRVRREGHWSLWRDGEQVYDRLHFDDVTLTWLARTGKTWTVMDAEGRVLKGGLDGVVPMPSAVGLLVMSHGDKWGALDGEGNEVKPLVYESPQQLMGALAVEAERRLSQAETLRDAIVAAAPWLLCRIESIEADPNQAIVQACQEVIPPVRERGGPEAVAQVLDLAVGLDHHAALAPFLSAIDWPALPKDILKRMDARLQLDALRDGATVEQLGHALDAYFTALDLARLAGESESDIRRLKTQELLAVREKRSLDDYFHVIQGIGGDENRELAREILPEAEQAIVKDMAKEYVAEMKRSIRESQQRAAERQNTLKQVYPALEALSRNYTRKGQLLELPLLWEDPLRAVMPVASSDGGEVVMLDRNGALHSLEEYQGALIPGLSRYLQMRTGTVSFLDVAEAASIVAAYSETHRPLMRELQSLCNLLHVVRDDVDWNALLYGDVEKVLAFEKQLQNTVRITRDRLGEPETGAGHLAYAYADLIAGQSELQVTEHLRLAQSGAHSLPSALIDAVVNDACQTATASSRNIRQIKELQAAREQYAEIFRERRENEMQIAREQLEKEKAAREAAEKAREAALSNFNGYFGSSYTGGSTSSSASSEAWSDWKAKISGDLVRDSFSGNTYRRNYSSSTGGYVWHRY